MAHHYDDEPWDEPWVVSAGIHRGKVYGINELDDIIEKYGTKTILEKLPIAEVERFVREKKLNNINS